MGHAGIQQPTKAPAQAARPPSQPQKVSLHGGQLPEEGAGPDPGSLSTTSRSSSPRRRVTCASCAPLQDLFTAALPSFQPLRASTAPDMAFGLSPAPAATPEAGEGAAPWTAGAGGMALSGARPRGGCATCRWVPAAARIVYPSQISRTQATLHARPQVRPPALPQQTRQMQARGPCWRHWA